jgi:acyl carrier protein
MQNGKVDRKALPVPAAHVELLTTFSPPITPTEKIIAGIIATVLQRKQVGLGDNFFRIGGHSLSATQVIARIGSSFGVDVPLRVLFRCPTVEGLARAVEQAVIDDVARMSDDEVREFGAS